MAQSIELNQRQQKILEAIVLEYISTAVPVGSGTIAGKYRLGVSPATVRNDMAALEAMGYIYHPHTSAGRVPSDMGYRFFVEHLMEPTELSPHERFTIRHQFHQVEQALDEWFQLAASILARVTSNTALVTLPLTLYCRLRRMDLVPIHAQLALLILVLQGGLVRKQIVELGQPLQETELERLSHRLDATYHEMTALEIERHRPGGPDSAVETTILDAVVRVMRALDEQGLQNMWYDGVTQMLDQPEFGQAERLRDLLEILHQKAALASILASALSVSGVSLVIGRENTWGPLQDCTIVINRYGASGETGGAIAVLGPTRMRYDRVVSSVRFISDVLSDLWQELSA